MCHTSQYNILITLFKSCESLQLKFLDPDFIMYDKGDIMKVMPHLTELCNIWLPMFVNTGINKFYIDKKNEFSCLPLRYYLIMFNFVVGQFHDGCTAKETCDSSKFLQCTNSKCLCLTDYYHNNKVCKLSMYKSFYEIW